MADGLVIVSREQILRRICGEFLEMPGLRLTLRQAQRLWGLDAPTCSQLLQSLVDQRFLCHHRDGTYSRVSDTLERVPMRMARAGVNRPPVHAGRK
jgi:hypothetical protein